MGANGQPSPELPKQTAVARLQLLHPSTARQPPEGPRERETFGESPRRAINLPLCSLFSWHRGKSLHVGAGSLKQMSGLAAKLIAVPPHSAHPGQNPHNALALTGLALPPSGGDGLALHVPYGMFCDANAGVTLAPPALRVLRIEPLVSFVCVCVMHMQNVTMWKPHL